MTTIGIDCSHEVRRKVNDLLELLGLQLFLRFQTTEEICQP